MHHSLALLALVAAVPLAAQERFHLRNVFQVGAVDWIEHVHDVSQTMRMDGKPLESRLRTTTWSERRVVDVKDGLASIEHRIIRMKISSSGRANLEENVEYDSDVEGSDPRAFHDMAAVVGQSIRARVDASGKVVDLELPAVLNGAAKATKDGLSQSFLLSFASWPADAVVVGGTWAHEIDVPMAAMGKMKANVTNRLIGVKEGVVTCEQKMVVDASALKLPAGVTIVVDKAGGTSTFALRPPMPVDVATTLDVRMVGGVMPAVDVRMRMSSKKVDRPASRPRFADAPKAGG